VGEENTQLGVETKQKSTNTKGRRRKRRKSLHTLSSSTTPRPTHHKVAEGFRRKIETEKKSPWGDNLRIAAKTRRKQFSVKGVKGTYLLVKGQRAEEFHGANSRSLEA